ncbi:uncharacterized protein I303_108652 [Kwoniella dejecticola CBS 10117]|uniref:Uncharacterized protein n=1 Tax=Kwoniella dejecticola CBS 10117 TaxID=1296121 RepID=A0A1A5ZWT4_9TREE|nr:uncharacterized protein I303_07023 [Kwoniella dejecticola CBS 10117]OBR82264.1 hypothetical protein I303_07023 [Kwoniella dejecticola CBS 10117]
MSPKSRLPPIKVKATTKSGSGSSSIPSSEAGDSKGDGKKKKKEEEEEGSLPFLDQVYCNICNEPFFDGIAKGRVFSLTTCGHLVCDDEEHQHKEGTCTVCGKSKIHTVTMEEGNLQPAQEKFFYNPTTRLKVLEAEMTERLKEFQEKVAEMSSFRAIHSFQQKQHKRTKLVDKEKLDKAYAEIERLQNELDISITEGVELKQAMKELQARLDMPPPPIPNLVTTSNGQYANHHQAFGRASNFGQTLPTVHEADERSLPSKRQRIGSTEPESNLIPPSTPVPTRHLSVIGGRSYHAPQSPHPVLTHPSEEIHSYRSATPVTRQDLERYRYNSTPLNGGNPQAYSQGYVQGTGPIGRPISAAGNVYRAYNADEPYLRQPTPSLQHGAYQQDGYTPNDEYEQHRQDGYIDRADSNDRPRVSLNLSHKRPYPSQF